VRNRPSHISSSHHEQRFRFEYFSKKLRFHRPLLKKKKKLFGH